MSFYWTNVGRETNIFAHIYTHRLTPITYSAQVLLYMTLFDVFVYFRSTNTVPVWMHVNWPWPNINSYHWYMHVPTMWILCHRYQPLSQRSIAGWDNTRWSACKKISLIAQHRLYVKKGGLLCDMCCNSLLYNLNFLHVKIYYFRVIFILYFVLFLLFSCRYGPCCLN